MFTFLPVIHHELTPTFAAPLLDEEAAPVAPPSWPAPPREPEITLESKFCVIRVARGFARKGFDRAPKATAATQTSVVSTPAVFFDPAAPDWPAPARPAAVALKLPRRPSVSSAEVTAQSVEAERLSC